METIIKTDVVIIGAGPTGLSLACQFVRYGIDFVVIEKNEGITPYSKAIGVQARTLEIYEQIGINYRHSSLSKHAGDENFAVKAGDRLPYFLVDGESVYDKLHQPKFHWLVFSNTQSDFQTLNTELESQHADLIDFNAILLHPQAAEVFGRDKSFNVLLRPDNYIGFISTETSPDELNVYLNKFVGHL